MDAQPIPPEWITKLFTCLEQFYGERFSKLFPDKLTKQYAHTIWQNGLYGCTETQIRAALKLCKTASTTPGTKPPHVMEFYKYCKGYAVPYIEPLPEKEYRGNPEIAKAAIKNIRARLRT